MKEAKCGDLKFGCNNYDYQVGTLVFVAPGQVMGIMNREVVKSQGWALLFHPYLLRGAALGHLINDYFFFSYKVNEALHLSDNKRAVVMDCFRKIEYELQQSIDKHSNKLITSNIELLLNYCTVFYDLQLITRSHVNKDILVRL